MKKLAIGLIAVLAVSIVSAPAWGRVDSYSLNVGIPVSFEFSEDENTQTSPSSKSPSGIQVMLGTPFYLSIGFASFESGFTDPNDIIWAERDVTYTFLEVMARFDFDFGFLGIGVGTGTAEFTPVSTGFFDINEADATEWFLMLGINLGDTWDIQAGFHAMTAAVELEFGGAVVASGDLGATLVTVGAGFQF